MIDTHVHVVSRDRQRHRLQRFDHPGSEWVDVAPDAASFVAELVPAGVDGAVLVQPHGAYGFDNTYVCEAADSDDRLAAVAVVDMTRPERADTVRSLAEAGVRGLRLFSIPTPATSWLDDPATDDVWTVAADAGLTVGVCVLPAELHAVHRAARRHGSQPVVLDHCGFAPVDEPSSPAWQAVLSLPENVVLKVTTHVIDDWVAGGRALEALFPRLVERFGADRLVWGSDYAQTHDRPYAELAALGRTALSALSDDDRAQVAVRTPAALWGLGAGE